MKVLLVGIVVLVVVLLASPALLGPPAFAWGDDCEFTRNIEREIGLGDSLKINVVAGAGKLAIEGDDDRKTVLIEAKLCAKTAAQLADMNVAAEQKGDVMHIKTELAKGRLWSAGSEGSYIDLSVYVPAKSALDVIDSSGSARVDGVGSLVMVDSSGELTIDNVSGNVRVKDSSGSLRIEQVAGNVSVTDSSGSIKVRRVTGDFTVEVDSSGSIEAEAIKGSVLIRSDSSGSIDVNEVGGDFTVGSDSSGGIYHNDVAGSVSLPN